MPSFLSSGHESKAAASVAAPHKPASLPCNSSLVSAGSSAQVRDGSSSAIRNFSFQDGADFIRKSLKAQTNAAAGITVDDHGITNYLGIAAERYANEQQSAFGNLCLRVHVETARTDVLGARDARHVFAVKENIHDQPRAIVITSLVVNHGVDCSHKKAQKAHKKRGRSEVFENPLTGFFFVAYVPFCGSLFTDDIGGHHAAARTDVCPFRERKTRE